MKGMIDDATFLWLREEGERLKKRNRKQKIRVLMKKKGCGTEKDNAKRARSGWIKVGCGVWLKKV
jgi:hypothetical protein